MRLRNLSVLQYVYFSCMILVKACVLDPSPNCSALPVIFGVVTSFSLLLPSVFMMLISG